MGRSGVRRTSRSRVDDAPNARLRAQVISESPFGSATLDAMLGGLPVPAYTRTISAGSSRGKTLPR